MSVQIASFDSFKSCYQFKLTNLFSIFATSYYELHFASSALTLLVGRQEGHPTCKKTEWSGAGVVICLELGADLHMAQLMPLPLTALASVKSRLALPFWYRLTRVVPDKGPLNGCMLLWTARSLYPYLYKTDFWYVLVRFLDKPVQLRGLFCSEHRRHCTRRRGIVDKKSVQC